ncbi:hypothetical protein FRC12_022474 [Ceratobasidium sp. 428]|nr:hypothetical protein FRC12_022474 [Ceratobasidium sp. 428]
MIGRRTRLASRVSWWSGRGGGRNDRVRLWSGPWSTRNGKTPNQGPKRSDLSPPGCPIAAYDGIETSKSPASMNTVHVDDSDRDASPIGFFPFQSFQPAPPFSISLCLICLGLRTRDTSKAGTDISPFLHTIRTLSREPSS